MRTGPLIVVMFVAVFVAGCSPGASGWRGDNVHLVDGTWIGREIECDVAGDQESHCRAVVREALRLIEPEMPGRVTVARVAVLPTTFVTSSGETRVARLSAGIMAREAVVVDLADGSQQVVGLWCHAIEEATCDLSPLYWWLDGNAPPYIPPGTKFG
jgi:hypothetical protein